MLGRPTITLISGHYLLGKLQSLINFVLILNVIGTPVVFVNVLSCLLPLCVITIILFIEFSFKKLLFERKVFSKVSVMDIFFQN